MIDFEHVKKEDGDELIILESYPAIDYTLIKRKAKYEPYVAAYNYSKESNSWGQGHYFSRLVDAAEWVLAKEGQVIGNVNDKYVIKLHVDSQYKLYYTITETESEDSKMYYSLEELAKEIISLTQEEDE